MPPDPASFRILLDVLGTVVYDPFYHELPAFLGMTREELLECKHPTAWLEFERGEVDEEDFLRRFFRDGRDYDRSGLKQCFRDSFRFLDGMEALLGELHASGWQLHLFSNYPVWYRWIEEKLALSRFAEWSCVSCHMGLRKPDPEAFARALEIVGAGPAEVLFIDDRERNCRAAEDFGLRVLRFQDATRLRAGLREMGIVG